MKRILFAMSALFGGLALLAQTDTGSIRVFVEDKSNAAIPAVKVTVLNTATGVETAGETQADGYATFTPLQRGTYSVRALKAGFKNVNVSGVTLNVDERRLIRVMLDVASLNETVEVTAAVAALNTEQGTQAQVISGRDAVELPLAARRYTELALLSPGVANSTLTPVTRGPGWLVANGNYHTQNNFLLDGVDNNQGTTNAQSLSAQVVQPSPDSIAEFKVLTNSFSAEYGRSAGAVVNVALKSGTNEMHGSGWLYNRDRALASTPWTNTTNSIVNPKPQLKWNQFGGTFGGPAIKNKLFYFLDYEGFLQDFADSFVTTVPTADEKAGRFARLVRDPATANRDPFAGNVIPTNRIDTLATKVVQLYPAGNTNPALDSAGRPRNNYAVIRDGKESTHKYNTRGDFFQSERDNFNVRFSYLRQFISRQPIFEGIGDGVGNQGTQYNNNQSFGFAWNRNVSSKVVNTLRYGVTRTYAEFAHATAGGQKADEFGFRGIPVELLQVGGLPLMDVSNYNSLGTRNFRPQFQRPWLNHLLETVSIVTGSHQIKAGFDMRLKNNTFIDITRRTPAYSFQGQYSADALGDLLLGLPERLTLNTVPTVNQLQQAWAGFFQDDWKVNPRLTLNLGLRYEFTTPFYGSGENENINFNPSTGNLIFANQDDRYTITSDRNNFGPRLGAAYQILPGRLVLRGGYGIFYNGEDPYGSEANLPLNPPQLIQINLLRTGLTPPVRLSDPVPANALTSFNTANVALRTREQQNRSGLIQQWNIALQNQIGQNNSFEVAYVANRGRNLFALWERNQTNFGVDGNIPANRPYPQWQGIQTGSTRSRSQYDSLQAKFERRFSKGLFALVSYTYASALDESGAWDAGASPQFRDDFRAELGPMSQLSRHRLTIADTWEIPFGKGRLFGNNWNRAVDALLGGWQMSHIVTWRTGLPVNVSLAGTGIDPATGRAYQFLARNGGGLRPNRIGDPQTGIDPKVDRFRFLNPAAFSVQPINTPGNSQRNVAVGPGLFTLDMTITKRFTLTERMSFDLRGEAFNLLNTVNFFNPNGSFGGATFGNITNARDPRQMQLAARFRF
jgi:hypothetical protein